MTRQPIGMYILIAYLALSGLITAVIGFIIVFMNVSVNPSAYGAAVGVPDSVKNASGVLFILLGIILLIVAAGLWKRKNWARYIVAGLATLNIITGFIQLTKFDVQAIIGILLAAIVLWYVLWHPGTQRAFSKETVQSKGNRKTQHKTHRNL